MKCEALMLNGSPKDSDIQFGGKVPYYKVVLVVGFAHVYRPYILPT